MTNAVEKYDESPVNVPAIQVSETNALIAMIERAAANSAVDVDKMERLLLMQERVMDRRAKAEFDAALAVMQPTLPQVDRNGRIIILSKEDRAAGRQDAKPQQSTPYALWEDINLAIGPCLAANGFALSFRTGTSPEGKITVTGVLSHKQGHREETTITLMHDSSGSKNSVQAIGSSISYGKRYTAGLLLNITSRAPGEADDDGKAAGATSYISEDQQGELRKQMKQVGADEQRFLAFMGVPDLAALPASRFGEAVERLAMKAKQETKK
jgi:hypothetical protein